MQSTSLMISQRSATIFLACSLLGLGCYSNPPVPPPKPVTATPLQPQPMATPTPQVQQVQQQIESQPATTKEEKLNQKYVNKLRDIYKRSDDKKLLAMRGELQELAVSVEGEPLKWNTLKIPALTVMHQPLEDLKKIVPDSARLFTENLPRFNAFRFRSPCKEPAYLRWIHGMSHGVSKWRVLRTKPPGPDFDLYQASLPSPRSDWLRDWNLSFSDTPLPPGSEFAFQEHLAVPILPDEEHILIFTLPQDADEVVQAALSFSAEQVEQPARSSTEIARRMGLEMTMHKFPKSSEGLQLAMETAERSVTRADFHPLAIWRILDSVWEQIPEIQHSDELGKPEWNRILPKSPFQFHVVRFRSPLDQAADLRSCTISEQHQFRQGFLTRDGRVPPWTQDWLEVDLPITAGNHPQQNMVILRELNGGQIQPGQECLFWFAPYRRIVPEFDLAIHFSPTGALDSSAGGRSTAPVFGLALHEELTARRVDVALDLCLEAAADSTSENTMEFNRLLQFVAPSLPVLKTSAGQVEWNETQVTRRAAFRVNDDPGPFMIAFVKQKVPTMNWGLVGLDKPGLQRGFRDTQPAEQYDVPTIAESIVEVGLFSAEAKQNQQPRVLFCYFAKHREAQTVQIAARTNAQPGTQLTNGRLIQSMGIRATGSQRGELIGTHSRAITRMKFLNDSLLATSSDDDSLRLWDLNNKVEPVQLHTRAKHPSAIAVSPDRRLLACAVADRSRTRLNHIAVRDATSLEAQTHLALPADQFPQATAFSPDGQSVLACVSNAEAGTCSLYVWRLDQPDTPKVATFEKGAIVSAHWLPNGQTIVASGTRSFRDKKWNEINRLVASEVRLLNSQTLEVERVLTESGDRWTSQAISADGKRVAFLSAMGFIRVLDTQTLKTIAQCFHSGYDGTQVELSADGSRLVSMDRDGAILVWDIIRDRVIFDWPATRPAIKSAAISPSGNRIAFCDADGQVRLVEIDESKLADDSRKTNSLQMEFARIPRGELERAEGNRNFTVQLTRPFFLGMHEVTVGQFRAFVDATGYRTTAEASGKGGMHRSNPKAKDESKPEWNWKNPAFQQDDRHPVVQVSWHDAVAFCEWLSKQEGKTYRLPTEAEWEYACRAGSKGNWFWGNADVHLPRGSNTSDTDVENAYGSFRDKDGHQFSAAVGSLAHNRFGIYDMHGNVQEWCSDWFEITYYLSAPMEDPTGPATGQERVQRGGSFAQSTGASISSARASNAPEAASSSTGFRVVLEVD